MIRLNNVRLPLDYTDDTIRKKVSRELKIDKSAIQGVALFRRSVDARKKEQIHFLCSVDVTLNGKEDLILKRCKNAVKVTPYHYEVPKWNGGAAPMIVGMGPAGLFAGLVLVQSGAKPIIIERGKDVDSRTKDVSQFWLTGKLDPFSNVQFGEGGAGTFSDGKLNTGTKDNRQRKVLEEFVRHGAPDEILYNAKPHIGTDKLKIAVRNIREKIISLGGTVLFETTLTGIKTENGKITAAIVERNGKQDIIETDSLILAIGHSARDTFAMLHELALPMEAKPFSVGARIEHLRDKIDKAQYGSFAGTGHLGAAYYKMNVHMQNGRGAYTFCMCPGGKVVNASSETGGLCTNGMSEFARNEQNSNAALLVGVSPEDYGSDSPLAGVQFQRKLEESAYALGGSNYHAPVQRVGDFLANRKSERFGEVLPSIKPGATLSNLHDILPQEISEAMKEAIAGMGKKLQGFDHPDAVLTGLETRSSSPVRILRSMDTLESVGLAGLYPCGEGAGYAGGIISAAVDGIKCAEKIIAKTGTCG